METLGHGARLYRQRGRRPRERAIGLDGGQSSGVEDAGKDAHTRAVEGGAARAGRTNVSGRRQARIGTSENAGSSPRGTTNDVLRAALLSATGTRGAR